MERNGLYNLFGGIFKLLFSVLTVPVLIRVLSLKGFGEYALITSIINIFSLSEWSIAMAATVLLSAEMDKTNRKKDAKRYNLYLSSIFIMLLFVSVFLFVILIFGKSWIGRVMTDNEDIIESFTSLVVPIAFTLAFRSLQQFFIGIEQAYSLYKLSNIVTTIYGIALSITTIISAYVWQDIYAIVFSQAVVTGFFVLVHCVLCLNRGIVEFHQFFHFSLSHIREVGVFSLKTWVGSFGGVLFSQGDKILINKLLGLEITGVYAALTSIAVQINIISALPVQPLVPVISEMISSGSSNERTLINVLKKSFLLNSILAVTLGVAIIIFSPELVVFFGVAKAFPVEEIATYLSILGVIYTLYSLNATGYYCLYASGKESYSAILVLFSSLITLLFVALLSIWLGPVGAFIGNGGFLCTLLLLTKMSKTMHVRLIEIFDNNIFVLFILPASVLIAWGDLTFIYRIFLYLALIVVGYGFAKEKLEIAAIYKRYKEVR